MNFLYILILTFCYNSVYSWEPTTRGEFPYLATVETIRGKVNAILVVNHRTILTSATYVTIFDESCKDCAIATMSGVACVDQGRDCMNFSGFDVKLVSYNNSQLILDNDLAIIALKFSFIDKPEVKSIFPYLGWVDHDPGTSIQILSLRKTDNYSVSDGQIADVAGDRPNIKVITHTDSLTGSDYGAPIILNRKIENYLFGLYRNGHVMKGHYNVLDMHYYRNFIMEHAN